MKMSLAVVLVALMPLAACSSIPENGSLLNAKVSEGIAKNQLETEKIIKALADVERAVLNDKWNDIFKTIEDGYIKKKNAGKGAKAKLTTATLSQKHRREIAENAAKTYYDLLGEIAQIEKDLIEKTRANSKAVIEVNDVVTKYLMSLESLDKANSQIVDKLSNITGINFDAITGKAGKLIKKIGGV